MTTPINPYAAGLQLTTLILEEQSELTLADICRACAIDDVVIIEMVEEGVLTPAGESPTQWRFSGLHLQHAKVAVRLQRDLGGEFARRRIGAAVARRDGTAARPAARPVWRLSRYEASSSALSGFRNLPCCTTPASDRRGLRTCDKPGAVA